MTSFIKQFHNAVYGDNSADGLTVAETTEQIIVFESGGFKIDGSPVNLMELKYDGSVKYSTKMNCAAVDILDAHNDGFGHHLEHFPVLHISAVTVDGLLNFYKKMKPYVLNPVILFRGDERGK